MRLFYPQEIVLPIPLPLFTERVPYGFLSPTQSYVRDRLNFITLSLAHLRPAMQLNPRNPRYMPIRIGSEEALEIFGVVTHIIKFTC